jgi:hypothetical protein
MWAHALPYVPSEVHTAWIDVALQLLRPLSGYGRLLPTGTAAAAAEADSINTKVWMAYWKAQVLAGLFLHQLCCDISQHPNSDAAPQIVGLLCEPAVQELLLKLLASSTLVLHKQHNEQQQQQQQQQRAGLLPIPAFCQGTMELLQGGQAQLDELSKFATTLGGDRVPSKEYYGCAGKFAVALEISLRYSCMPQPAEHGSLTTDSSAPALSAGAVQMVLELQLLAASSVQRLQQMPQQQEVEEATQLLKSCNSLLHKQIKAVLQVGSSHLPPEVLQQAGLQLLQALAVPVQQLQLTENDDPWRTNVVRDSVNNVHGSLGQQLMAFTAAAPGLLSPLLVAATIGETLRQH